MGNLDVHHYMRLYTACHVKLTKLEHQQYVPSVVELNMNNRILITFLFVFIDIIICISCYPRKSIFFTFLWMLFWSFLSFISYTTNQHNPLFIVLAVNAIFPLLTKQSKN